MRERIEKDLGLLYERYGRVLRDKEQVEIELRIRQGMLNLLAQAELEEKAKAESEEKANAQEEES